MDTPRDSVGARPAAGISRRELRARRAGAYDGQGGAWADPAPARPPAVPAEAAPLVGAAGDERTFTGWGQIPLVAISVASGLLAIAVADTAARIGASWSEAFFWFGLLTLYVPPAVTLVLSGVPRHQRIASVVLLALGLYVVKLLHSPDRFAFGDEFAHWRTAADIAATGHLFQGNPLSIVSPSYPGLEVVTTAVTSLTGLSIEAAGVVVLGGARLLLALSLFLLVERLSRSARIAAIACLLYTGNPNFTFWSAQFAYESLSLPLAIAILYLAIRRIRAREGGALDPLMVLATLALVPTHHLTSYALIALLVAWAVVAYVMERRGMTVARPPRAMLLITPVWAILWVSLFARDTVRYLEPVVGGALHDAWSFLIGEHALKTFFRGDPTLVSPAWERVVAFIAVGLLAGVLAFALFRWFRSIGWRPRFRGDAIAWTFAIAALLYFPIQAVRAIQSGTEISNRAGEFLYLPIGFVIALAVRYLWVGRGREDFRVGTVTAFAVVLFMGGVIVGMPRWARLPGPYLVSGDTRAIGAEGLAASAWLRSTFGSGQKVVADQTNELLMGSYGGQDMEHGLSWVYFSPRLGSEEIGALAREEVRFLVVDRRLTTMLPVVGYYFEPGEPRAGRHNEPIAPEDLGRFDASPAFRKVYDSGDIAIYAVDAGAAGTSGSNGGSSGS